MLSPLAIRKIDSLKLDIRDSLPFSFLLDFLLSSCILFLLFEASPNRSFDIKLWSRKERDKKVCRRKGLRDCALFSFVLKSFRLRGILRKPITAPRKQNGWL